MDRRDCFVSYSRNSIHRKKNDRGNSLLKTKHRVCLFGEHVDTVISIAVVYFTFNIGYCIVLNHIQYKKTLLHSIFLSTSSVVLKKKKTHFLSIQFKDF